MAGLGLGKGEKNQAALSQMLGTLGPLDFPGFAKPHFEPFCWALSIRRPWGHDDIFPEDLGQLWFTPLLE